MENPPQNTLEPSDILPRRVRFYALYRVIIDFINFQYRDTITDDFTHYTRNFNLIDGIVSLIILLGATFGIVVVGFTRDIQLLKIYEIIGYLIATIRSVIEIASFIILIAYKNQFIDFCNSSIVPIDKVDANTYFVYEVSGDNSQGATIIFKRKDCETAYRWLVPEIFFRAFFTTLLSIYFAIVISSYTRERRIQAILDDAHETNTPPIPDDSKELIEK
ncbi:hypothetical protein G9A89_017878 [Geosiphon pyriformis]|nr:hypothetical protein G9A89_017878 [Geosiphon pyriformis]